MNNSLKNIDSLEKLSQLQAWFGKVIARPLINYRDSQNEGIFGGELITEANEVIRSTLKMNGHARLNVYNQQYWFRLISILQTDYQCTVHIVGLQKYNQWVIRYLQSYPSDSPFLAALDQNFLKFMLAEYHEKNRECVLQAVEVDQAFSRAFEAGEPTPLKPGADFLSTKIRLAKHITPLALDWDFTAYRDLCLKDESLEEEFVLRATPGKYVSIYRHGGELWVKPLSSAAYHVLMLLKNPQLLPDIFEKLEAELSPDELAEMEDKIQGWFQDWMALGWISQA